MADYIYFTLIIILGINVTICESQETNSTIDDEIPRPCIYPSDPEHGEFISVNPIDQYKPGELVSGYWLNVTCSPGFSLVGDPVYVCREGTVENKVPICVRNCKRDVSNDRLVKCPAQSAEEAQCYDNDVSRQLNKISDKSTESDLMYQLISNCTSHEQISRSAEGYPAGIQPVFAQVDTATRQDTPWHVGVYSKTTTLYKNICGGSVISSLVVISAAHCFWSDLHKQLPAAKFAVAAGKLYKQWNDSRDEHAQKTDVVDIRLPARYQGSTGHFQCDLALLVVASPFEYKHHVRPVCLDFDHGRDENDLQQGNLGKVSGWGLVGQDGQQVAELQVGELPVVEIHRCIEGIAAHFKSYITSDKFCAGYTNGTALCKGDSGGGLAFRRSGLAEDYTLRGVVSAAPREDKPCNVHSWATFTHIVAHERFIITTLKQVHE